MADIVQADDPSLAVSYSDCINSFAKFVLTLSESDCDVIRRDEVQITQIFEEYGRIKIWADQSKADLPATARGSLDDILRHDDELKSLVRDILQRLKGLLQQAMYIAERKYDPEDDMDRDSISSVSDSDYSTDDGDEPQHHRIPKIRLLVRQIADQIRSLHDISSLLRRPTVSDKFIRSKKADPKAATLQEPDRFYPDGIFGIFDYNHIFEKVLQWRGLNKSLQNVDFSIEDGAPVGNALNNQQIEDIGWLCQRLARANTKRREQLQYWKSHPYESKQSFTGIEPDSEIDLDILVRGITPVKRQKDEESRSQVSTIKPPDPHVLHEGPKSILSKQSFSTVAFSDVHDTGTNIRARTIYAPTAIGQDRAISVPGPPKMDQDTNFRCPYCGMSLGSEYSKRQLWKRHVFRDLRPYICTFQQCHSAEKLFSSRHEWKHHEFQIHRREYVCQRCQYKCTSKKEMSTHLRVHYGDLIPSPQADVILDLCDRQVDPSDTNIEPCIICGEEEISLSVWHDHVAAHMENLSLFVLPAPENDEETEGSAISGKADVLDSNNYSSGSESTESSLGFSVAGDHSQNPADFAKTLADEAGYSSRLAAWEATDEDITWQSRIRNQMKMDPAPLIDDFDSLMRKLETNTLSMDDSKDYITVINQITNSLCERYSRYEWRSRETKRFERRQLDMVQLSQRLFGESHPMTLTSMAYLASTYQEVGRWKEAESLLVTVTESRKTVLGLNNPDTLKSMHNLALIYLKQERLKEAESLLVTVTESRKTLLGLDHPDTLNSMENLASVYRQQGRLEEAKSVFPQVMAPEKMGIEPERPGTPTSASSSSHISTQNPKILETVQDAMRRLILPELSRLTSPELPQRSSFDIFETPPDDFSNRPESHQRPPSSLPRVSAPSETSSQISAIPYDEFLDGPDHGSTT